MKLWKSVKKVENEFLWKPLTPKFQDVLMSSNFVIRECGDDQNNCLINCIEIALKSDNIKIDAKYIKKNFTKYVKHLDIKDFIKIRQFYVKSLKEGFKREWDPRSILRQKELAYLIEEGEFFIGNDLETLYLMSMYLGIEFLIFDDKFKAKKIGDQQSIIYLFYDSKKNKYNIIGLKYYKKDKIVTQVIFNKKDLPDDIKVLRNIKTYLLENAKKVFFKAMENKESFAMDELVKRVEDNIYLDLDDNYRKQLENVMIFWLTK